MQLDTYMRKKKLKAPIVNSLLVEQNKFVS